MSKLYSETRACANPANFYRVLNQVMPTEQCQQLFALISERSCRVRDRLVGHPSEFLRICGGTVVCQCLEKARRSPAGHLEGQFLLRRLSEQGIVLDQVTAQEELLLD